MDKKIFVYIKEPGQKVKHVWISASLENLQKTVGGYIETVTFANDFIVLCDEEGRFKGYPHNVTIFGVEFVGTIIIVGTENEDFENCPLDIQQMRKICPQLFFGTCPHRSNIQCDMTSDCKKCEVYLSLTEGEQK